MGCGKHCERRWEGVCVCGGGGGGTGTVGICHQIFIKHLLWASACAKGWGHGRNLGTPGPSPHRAIREQQVAAGVINAIVVPGAFV